MKDATNVKKILEDTAKAYGIQPQFVFASRYDEPTDTVFILTNGGKKIVHKVGAAIGQKPTEVEITGILPKEEMLWSKKHSQGIKLSELEKNK